MSQNELTSIEKKIWRRQHVAFKISMFMAVFGLLYISIMNALEIPIQKNWLAGFGMAIAIPDAFNSIKYWVKKRNSKK